MTKIKQKSDGRGSLRQIQLLINKNQDQIDNIIKKEFPELAKDTIIWKSPKENEGFAEYRDNEFIDQLELDRKIIKLDEFWPTRGAQWDAFATTKDRNIILVEAKANIPEIVTPATSAGPKSKSLIDKSLKETKEFLGIKNDIDWSGKFYQYTNRLAHLYFLREKHNKPAYLLNVYFIGDKTVNGPESIQEWKGALQVLYSYLGIANHKLSKYMTNIFIDVKTLKQ
ncbi:MAG: hypothetical protein A3K10_12745 [Bacteroidetes bacterium RIFCSPLOWO2_12_FULL_31_6]|nr:MAG: hypothetical protein A3K10_12745 [Bacteroidetes bacterium RIFCSPLOWO2_12_FULL_31_6]